MTLFKRCKKKYDEVKGSSVEDELIEFLEISIRSKDHQTFSKSNTYYVESHKILIPTITALIILLLRNQHRNSLHMQMIMYLIKEVEKYHTTSSENEDLTKLYIVESANLILESCFETMILAEKKTRKYKDIEKIVFKDEKILIDEYFARNSYENNEVR
ncbi:hypothetical protein M3175_20465 [Robertmurraya korlensis]|uniref:hypothetical protein n=1 Tax=Robertmurraya korlensis TaxID=519977 RepID=UPI00203C0F2D|nr:hypothetical protein [Robertmurraya korlensis]MCM3603116.1 hypothetical protein [Robertmurraya korlensis]